MISPDQKHNYLENIYEILVYYICIAIVVLLNDRRTLFFLHRGTVDGLTNSTPLHQNHSDYE